MKKKLPYKVRLWVGDILIMLSVFVVIGICIFAPYSMPVWLIVLLSFVAAVIFIVGFVFIPKTSEEKYYADERKKEENK